MRLSINVTLMWLELRDDDDATVQSSDLAWVHVGADPEKSQTQMSSLISNPPCEGWFLYYRGLGRMRMVGSV